MESNLPIKELVIAVVEKDGSILMRKKPEGAAPYKETWYLFGCERIPTQDDQKTLKDYLKFELGIDVNVSSDPAPTDFEIKNDHDGIEKNFIYINFKCQYLGGIPKVPAGAEKIEWIPKERLVEYDLVPPSLKLLKTMGYMN